jgi:hypothetical protein
MPIAVRMRSLASAPSAFNFTAHLPLIMFRSAALSAVTLRIGCRAVDHGVRLDSVTQGRVVDLYLCRIAHEHIRRDEGRLDTSAALDPEAATGRRAARRAPYVRPVDMARAYRDELARNLRYPKVQAWCRCALTGSSSRRGGVHCCD